MSYRKIKIYTVLFSMFFTLNLFAAAPSTPILPSDNIQDPGDILTPWGGCGPTDNNCYIELTSFTNENVTGLDYSTSTGVLSLTSGYTIPLSASTTQWANAIDTLSNNALLQNGNSFGNTLILGTNDNNALSFKTNGNVAMAILANGNVGVGTTTPGYKLTLGSGQFGGPTGSASSPTYSFTNSSDMGMYRINNGGLGFAVNGSGVLTMDLSANIYTTGRFQTGNGSVSSVNYGHVSAPNTGLYLTSTTAGLSIAGTSALHVDSSRNIGVGTISPSARLHIISTTEQFRSGFDESNYLNMTTSSVGGTTFNAVGTTPQFTFSDSINVNTGANTSSATFNKSHNTTSFVSNLAVNTNTPLSGSNLNQYGINSALNASAVSGNISNSNLFSIYSYIAKTGTFTVNNLVGNYSQINNATNGGSITNAHLYQGVFSVDGSGSAITNAYGYRINAFTGSGSSTVTNMFGVHLGSLKSIGVTNAYGIFQEGVSDFNYFAGNVGIGTTTPADKLQVFGDVRLGTTGSNGCIKDFAGTSITGTCSSDERLKTNVVDISDGYLEKMNNLKVITYNWNESANTLNKVDTTVTNYGLLAQNVEASFPELVSTDSNGYKQVNYSRLPIYLLKSVQELSSRVVSIFDGTAKVKVKELCIEDVCVTKNQLQQLLQSQNIQTVIVPTPSFDTTPEVIDNVENIEPVVQIPVVEPVVVPEVLIENVPTPEVVAE